MTDEELYQEENRKLLIEIRDGLKGFVAPTIQLKDKVKFDGELKVNTEKAVEITNISEFGEQIDKIVKIIDDKLELLKPIPIKEQKSIEVSNIKDAQAKELRITNLEDLKSYFTTLGQDIKDGRPINKITQQQVVFPSGAKNAIPVRLSDGKSFYNALFSAISGGSQDQRMQFTDNGELKTTANIDMDTEGIATSDNQTNGNQITKISGAVTVNTISGFALETGHLATIDSHTPALGQALAAASVPVILPSATITTLTPPAAITGFATSAKQLADGHSVALSATDNAVLDNIDSNTDSGAVVGVGAAATAQRVHLADESLSALENITVISSGTVTANAGTNLNTSTLAIETGGNLASIKTNTDKLPALGQALAAASLPVVLTAAQITTLTPPAAITGFATAAKQLADGHTVALSATDNAVLDTIAAKDFATQTTLSTVHGHVDSIDTKTPALGQALAAASVPVILPAATVTTLTPPAAISGFATSAKQLADGHSVALSATDNAVLDAIDSNTDSGAVVGVGAAATAQRVHLADESLSALENITVTSSGTVTANAGTNLNTSALAVESGGNLASIKTNTDKIPALGQALAAASVPVILPVATITTLTPPAAITGFATSAKQLADNHQVTISNIANTPLVDITTLATSAKQLADGHSVALSAIDNAVLDTIAAKDFATQTTLAALNAKLVTGTDIGDVTINNSTGASAVNIQDGGNSITIDGAVTTSGTVTEASAASIKTAVELIDDAIYVDDADWTDSTSKHLLVGGLYQSTPQTITDGDVGPLEVDATGNLRVAGTVTANLSATDNAVLDAIEADTSIIAGAVSSTHMQVDVLTAPTTAVTGTFWQATQPISGTVTANTGLTQPLTDTQLRATAVPISVATIPSHAVTNAGTFATQATLAAETTKVIGTVNQGTSPWVTSNTTTSVVGAGAAATAQRVHLSDEALAALENITVTSTGVVTATDLDIRNLTNTDVVTAELSATDNAVLDVIAAKDFATQTTLALIKAKTDNIPVLGQALAAGSVPVILPTATITTLTPPAAITGFATETTLGTIHGHVDSIDTKTPALGQALAAASVPVILPSATITTLTPPAAITGFATSAKQDTQDTSINTLLKPASTLTAVTTLGTITNVVHVDDNAGSLTVDNPVLSVVGAGAAATAQRVQLSDESLAALENITVISSGTVTANAGTNLNTSALATEAGHIATVDTSTAAVNTLLGAKTDAKSTATDATSVSAMQVLKQISASVQAPPSQAVTGTFYQATQPVSIATMPSTPVTGTFWQATQPISGAVTNAVLSVVGGGAEATAQRVTIASDSTGVLSVDDNGGSLTVDGTVAVTNAGITTIAGAVSGTEMQVDVLTLPVGHNIIDSGTVTAVTSITNNVNTVEVAPTTILNGKTVVTTAATRVALAASTACKSVTIKALIGNTGVIYVGNTTVAAANGFVLSAGETVSLDIANLITVNIDSSVNGEGVSYIGIA